MKKRQFDPEFEKQIRRDFFHNKIDWRIIMSKYGCSESMLRRIVGGPLGGRKGIEAVYQ